MYLVKLRLDSSSAYYLPLTTYYLLLTTYYSLPTTHYSLRTAYYLLLTTYYSLLTTYYSLLTTYEARKIAIQKAQMVRAQLDEGLIDALARKGDSVDKLEFVVGGQRLPSHRLPSEGKGSPPMPGSPPPLF